MNKIYVMQGRLSVPTTSGKIQEFPYDRWTNEFVDAKNIGLDGIEWVCDFDLRNPLLNLYELNRIKNLKYINNLDIKVFCMDFLEDSDDLFNTNYQRLLASHIHAINYITDRYSNFIVIPLFCELTKKFINKFFDKFIDNIWFDNSRVIFEIDDFKSFDKYMKGFSICYDMGNRMLSAYKICDELIEFKDSIKHIHIKEKRDDNKSVSIGKGIIGLDGWEKIFKTLKDIDYKYDFTLQIAREEYGDEIKTVKKQYEFIKGLINANR